MGRKVRSGGSTSAFSFNKSKKYRYNSSGTLEEFTGDPGAEEITISGSKSSLRRMADMERNISILATKLTTSDGGTTDGDDASFGTVSNKATRFKKSIRMDDELDMRDNIDMNSKKLLDLADPTSAQHAATKAYVDAREAAAEATAAADATSKANAAQAAAISAAASDATSKADAAVAALVNGANASFDTLKEIQDAMATDAELSAAINGLTIGNGTMTVTAGAGMTGGGSFTANQTGNSTVTLNAIAGNGITVNANDIAMSGSFSGSFVATGDITAYSDESLKTNIQTIDNALDRVEAVRGVTFDRLEDGSTSTGVVAQELLEVLPEAVHTDANGVHSVAYGNITGLLIEAVKELSAEVKELKK
jgi:hypothetical protein